MGRGDLLDQLIPQANEQRIVSIGPALKARVLNGLGFANSAWYLTELFFRDKPVERLIGQGITAEHWNDDTLGRALDAWYNYGTSWLYPQLSAQAISCLGWLCRFGHLDNSSVHVDGNYHSGEDVEEGVVHITPGYSRDHRPDLNPIVLPLVVERPAGIPMLRQTLDGNQSDKVSFRETVEQFAKQMPEGCGVEYLVADSALYTADNLKVIDKLGWISRVPESLTPAPAVIDKHTPTWLLAPTEPASHSLEIEYGGIKQRWVIIFSPEAYQRTTKTLNRPWLKQSNAELKAFNKLCQPAFACEADARQALIQLEKTLKYSTLSDTAIRAIPRFKGKGRLAKDCQPDYFDYHIDGAMASDLLERHRRRQRKSSFILASNQLDSEQLPDAELIAAYQDQPKVERGFRFLKDPLFMASTLYLKSPKRIEALMMVMTLSWLVYAALEHRIRDRLKKHDAEFPHQQGQLIHNPTARWVFQFFTGIQRLIIQQHENVPRLVLNLNESPTTLLRGLGRQYLDLYTEN